MSIFGTILTALTTLLFAFVFWRVNALLRELPENRRPRLGPPLTALWLVFILGRFHGGGWGFFSSLLELSSMHLMAVFFLLAVGLLAADLISGFGLWFRPALRWIRLAGLAAGILLVILAHVQGLRPPRMEAAQVSMKDLPRQLDGTQIVVMSDWHAGEMMIGGAWLQKRVDQTMAQKPDLVLLVGDLFERGSGAREMVPPLSRLKAPLGVWAVRGNHDSLRSGRPDRAGEILRAAGVRLLENEHVEIAPGLVLAGIDDLTRSSRNSEEGMIHLSKALADRPPSATILLSHTPWLVNEAASAGVDLMLSGHTHNGQIWPFNYLVKLRYPYIAGRYELRGMTLWVSRGTGTWGPRMRLWQPGEITLITLRSR